MAVPDARCPRCQHVNPEHSHFCNLCGAALTVDALPVAAQRFASPGRYTPEHLAEKILSTKTALEGERKQVTVLFADLKDSMAVLAGRDPEDARKILDPLLDLMMEAVHRYEGTVNQVMGDGIMALFGAPIAHEDHAVRACYASLRMQESVRRYGERLRASHGVDLRIRVGLNSGEVVVRSISNDLRLDYTAVGQTTHLAARMEQTATPGTIRVTAETLRLAEGYVQHRPLGRLTVKGLSLPIAIHEIVGVPAAPSRMHPVAARGLTRFVGRDRELAQLVRALELAGTGHGQVAAVVGEPGVGKSRVCSELVSSPEASGWRALRAGAVSYGKTTPYLPVTRLLEAYVGIERRRSPEDLAKEVTTRLLSLDVALEGALPAILALLGLPGTGTAWEALDPPRRRARTLDAIRHVLARESRTAPLLIVLEDLQWIDGETQAVLDRLGEHLPGLRLLLLVNFRPEYQHAWSGCEFFHEIRIESLPAVAAHDFLDHLLGTDASLAPLKTMLVERTEGNPFFLEESVRNLVEAGSLAGAPGGYRVAKPIDSIVIAPSVQAVLAARIDRLDAPEKRLLQAAAVIGKDVRLPWLRGIAEDPHEVDQHVTGLRAADFIHEVPGALEPLYTFKHALTHEVAYAGILNDRKRLLHGRVVDVIEALHGGRLHEHADHLAHHALNAERWDKAIDHLRAAAARAYASGAVSECLARYEHGLALLGRLGPGLPDRRRAIDLHLDVYGPLFFLGQFDRLAALSRQAAQWAEAIGDRHRLGRASVRLAAAAGARGEYQPAIDHARQALEVAQAVDDRELRVAASHLLGVCHEATGDHPAATRFLASVVDGPDADLARQRLGLVLPPYIFDTGWMALSLAFTGDFRRAREYSRRAVGAAEENDHPAAQTFAYAVHASTLVMHGQFIQAGPWAERAVELGEQHQAFAFLPTAYSTKGWLYAWLGRPDEGLEYLERSIAFLDAVGLRMHAGSFHVRLAEGLLLAGKTARAREAAAHALTVSETLGERGSEADALRLLGDVELTAGDLPAAERFYRRSSALATALGLRPLVAHSHAGLARLYRRQGDAGRAEEHFTAAAAIYGDVEMRYWLEGLATDMHR